MMKRRLKPVLRYVICAHIYPFIKKIRAHIYPFIKKYVPTFCKPFSATATGLTHVVIVYGGYGIYPYPSRVKILRKSDASIHMVIWVRVKINCFSYVEKWNSTVASNRVYISCHMYDCLIWNLITDTGMWALISLTNQPYIWKFCIHVIASHW